MYSGTTWSLSLFEDSASKVKIKFKRGKGSEREDRSIKSVLEILGVSVYLGSRTKNLTLKNGRENDISKMRVLGPLGL